MQRDLTSGSVTRNVLKFSLPYLFSYFLQTLYGMADLFIIGQYEAAAASTAVANGSQVMHMLTVVLVGLAMGTTVSIAQGVGAGRHKDVSRAVGNTITLFLLISLVLTGVLLLLVRPIVDIMFTPQEAVEGMCRYLTICFMGIPFITAYNIIAAIFRGLGDSKSPMYFILVACICNIVLDYVFIGLLRMGASGAALGTTISQMLSVLLSVWVIAHRKDEQGNRVFDIHREDLRLHRGITGRILRIGLPIACQDGLIQVAFLLITVIANRRGLTDSAAVGIVEKVISFLFLVPSSMLSTVSALGAQNIGAGKPERARQTMRVAMLIASGFGLTIALVMQFTAEWVVGLFTPDAAVIAAGGQYMRGYIWDCLFAGIHFCFSGYFCACGRSMLSFLHNILAVSLARVPGAALTAMWFPDSLFPMGLATVLGSILSVVICLVAYGMMHRKEMRTHKTSA